MNKKDIIYDVDDELDDEYDTDWFEIVHGNRTAVPYDANPYISFTPHNEWQSNASGIDRFVTNRRIRYVGGEYANDTIRALAANNTRRYPELSNLKFEEPGSYDVVDFENMTHNTFGDIKFVSQRKGSKPKTIRGSPAQGAFMNRYDKSYYLLVEREPHDSKGHRWKTRIRKRRRHFTRDNVYYDPRFPRRDPPPPPPGAGVTY